MWTSPFLSNSFRESHSIYFMYHNLLNHSLLMGVDIASKAAGGIRAHVSLHTSTSISSKIPEADLWVVGSAHFHFHYHTQIMLLRVCRQSGVLHLILHITIKGGGRRGLHEIHW